MMNALSEPSPRIIPQITETKRAAIREAVTSGAALTGAYLAMNLAAALIAGFGLIENSPAVIIGAMLIAMLYGPIVGIALGLAEANMQLLGRALFGGSCRRCIGFGRWPSNRHIDLRPHHRK